MFALITLCENKKLLKKLLSPKFEIAVGALSEMPPFYYLCQIQSNKNKLKMNKNIDKMLKSLAKLPVREVVLADDVAENAYLKQALRKLSFELTPPTSLYTDFAVKALIKQFRKNAFADKTLLLFGREAIYNNIELRELFALFRQVIIYGEENIYFSNQIFSEYGASVVFSINEKYFELADFVLGFDVQDMRKFSFPNATVILLKYGATFSGTCEKLYHGIKFYDDKILKSTPFCMVQKNKTHLIQALYDNYCSYIPKFYLY